MKPVMYPYTVEQLIDRVEDKAIAEKMLALDKITMDLQKEMPAGAVHHGTRVGGYRVHITGVMNIGYFIYTTMGKMCELPHTWTDQALVLYLHDIDKLYLYEREDDEWAKKKFKKIFRIKKNKLALDGTGVIVSIAANAGIKLGDLHIHGLTLAHGGWSDIFAHQQNVKFHPIATIMHTADLLAGFVCDDQGGGEKWWENPEWEYLVTREGFKGKK